MELPSGRGISKTPHCGICFPNAELDGLLCVEHGGEEEDYLEKQDREQKGQ